MKAQKKMVILRKGNDVKNVSEKSFSYFHFLGLGYLIQKSIPKEIKDKAEKEAINIRKQVEKKHQIKEKEQKVVVLVEEKAEKIEKTK